MDFNYEKLLDRAKEKLPEVEDTGERFEMPKVRGHLEGNKVVLSNFLQIAQTLRRDPRHLLKFVLKSLATPGEIKKNFVVLGSKVSSAKINEKIEQYVNEYVFCKECHKPDTKLKREGDYVFMVCQACGARHSVKSKI